MNFCMLRSGKQIVCLIILGALALTGQSARAFSLAGPIANGPDAYQVPAIAYNVPGQGELTAPKPIDQEFRRNTPIMYYAADANFLGFFGHQGVEALDQAM